MPRPNYSEKDRIMHISELHIKTTNAIIDAMKTAGTGWTKNWAPRGGKAPTSISTGKPYNGINVLILGMANMAHGYSSNEYGTFKAWKNKACCVGKGEKAAAYIVWYGSGTRQVANDDGTEETKHWKSAKVSAVFNAEQVDGYTPSDIGDVSAPIVEADTAMDKLAHSVGADVRNVDLAKAFYVPSADYVNMPRIDQFDSAEGYACTLGHELTHWTGHVSRLDRNLNQGKWSNDNYAFEELVAELGSAFLAASLGISIEPRDDHAKYINGWIKQLKDKPSSLMSAASKAQHAATYLLPS